jgi:hypothetical protein
VTGPSWLTGGTAVVMIATAVYCVSRMIAAWRWRRPTEYDVDGVHVLMGVGMAGMLVPRLNPAAGSGWDVGGAAIFGAAMVWFGWRTIRSYRDGQAGSRAATHPGQHAATHPGQHAATHPGQHAAAHPGQHLLASGAMLYMFLAAPSVTAGGLAAGGTAMAAAGARIPTFALLLAVALRGYVSWTPDRRTSLTPAAGTVAAGGQAPVPAAVTVAASGQAPAPAAVTVAAGGRAPVPSAQAMSLRLAAGCEIVMGVAMGYMLITML